MLEDMATLLLAFENKTGETRLQGQSSTGVALYELSLKFRARASVAMRTLPKRKVARK